MKKKPSGHIIVLHRILSDPFRIEHTLIGAELIEDTGADLRNESGQKDHMADGTLRRHERQKHAARRMRYHYHIPGIIFGLVKRFDDDIRIAGCAGFRLSGWQVYGQSLMPAFLKF